MSRAEEAGESEVEWVEAIALTDAFGVTGPAQLPCLPLRFHVAQKLHGMTECGGRWWDCSRPLSA